MIVGVVVALSGIAAGAWALRGTGVSRWVRDPRMVMKPGKLIPVHEAVKELTDCNSCHALDSPIPEERCFECHEVIRERRAAQLGHHGRNLLGTCHDCHVDHEPELIVFDRATFNHEQAVFALRGRHADLECEKCHEKPTGVAAQPMRMQYIGLEHETCTACHDDPHGGSLTADERTCVDCHDQDGWTGRHLRFVHDRDSSFRLEGKHGDVACTACHVPRQGSTRLADAQLRSTGNACADCHADPHAAQFAATDCAACHVPQGFKAPELRFDHRTVSEFRLEGAHATVACAECHVVDEALGVPLFRGTAKACAGCHADPHAGQFDPTPCADCHRTQAFKGEQLTFDHRGVSRFPLTGKHVAVPCAECHAPIEGAATTFRGTSTECAACHQDPHGGQFQDTACDSCHRSTGFKGTDLAFRHIDLERFVLTGAHAVVECAACHKASVDDSPVVFRGGGTTCDTCHEDPHARSVSEKPCTACHATVGWGGTNLLFDHARDAALALDATHASIPCAACHDAPAFRPVPTDCAGCHADVAAALAGSAGGERLEASPHAELVACTKCHDPDDGEASTTVIAPRCATCHNPRYAKLALDRQALLDDLLLRGRRAVAAMTHDNESRARLALLRRAAAHDFAPAERRLRELVDALER